MHLVFSLKVLDFVIFLWYFNSRRSVRRQTDARAGRKALVHQEAGIYPAISFIRRRTGLEKVLSIFIDESGDFGGYSKESPFYMVGMVFHDQSVDITEDIAILNRHIAEMGFPPHAVHMGPLIRRESIYLRYDDESARLKLLNTMYHFTRKLDIHYICPCVDKSRCADFFALYSALSRTISDELNKNMDYLSRYERIIIYYDNGQHELNKIITSVFSILFTNVEFRKVQPSDYKLFQVADLICTWELLALKAERGVFTESEKVFFDTPSKFLKNRYKLIAKKKL